MSRKRKIMVCVTQQKSCERLLSMGAQIINPKHDELFMVHIVKENWRYFSQMKESDAMEYLYEVAKTYDASVNVIKAKDIEEALAQFAKKHQITTIVLGQTQEKDLQQNMINRIMNRVGHHVDLVIVDGTEETMLDGQSVGF